MEEKNTSVEKNSNTAKTVGLVMVIMLLGKITGLLRDIILNGKMGTESIERTALDPALTIPAQFLDFAFAAALSSSFVPVFNYYLEKKTKKEAFALANSFITAIIIATTCIVISGMVFSPQLINIFASGVTDQYTIDLAVILLQMMLPTIALTAAAFALTGILQSLGEFNIPAAMSIISNLIIIVYFLFLYGIYGVKGLAVAFLVGWGTQVLVQIPSLARRGYIYKFNFNFACEGMKETAVLMLPVIVSTWVQPVNTLVNKKIASGLYEGAGMNILSTASGFYSVITGVFILSIANVIFPKLSKLHAGGDSETFAQTLKATLRISMFILIPMSVGLFLMSEPVIRLVYERWEFDAVSTQRSSFALSCYATGMVGLGLQTILSRAFYALKDAKTPLITAVIAMAVNLFMSVSLVEDIGIGGPALASGLSINVTGIIMLVVMWRRDKNSFDRASLASVVKMGLCSVFMGVVVYGILSILPDGRESGFLVKLAIVCAPVTIGLIVYIVSAFLLKIAEADVFVSQLINFTRKLANKLIKKAGGEK